jgi:hypothetical protein
VKYFKTFLFVLISILVGLGVAIFRIADFEHSNAFFHNGNWMGSKDLPLGKDDLLTAQITCFALFALPGEEAIYLFAKRDKDKEKFHSKNNYIISGNVNQIHAKYWSITAYGKDHFLIPNSVQRYAFNNSSIELNDSTGNFSITVSSEQHPGNWLPSPKDAGFSLVLRIYRGEKDFIAHLEEAVLPEIEIMEK